MLNDKMQSTQNLVDELVKEYVESKYDKKYLKEKVTEILEFILPEIAIIIKDMKEKEIVNIWNSIKEDEKIKNLFKMAMEKIERPIVIYVASKFENNKYFGTRIIEDALKWK